MLSACTPRLAVHGCPPIVPEKVPFGLAAGFGATGFTDCRSPGHTVALECGVHVVVEPCPPVMVEAIERMLPC